MTTPEGPVIATGVLVWVLASMALTLLIGGLASRFTRTQNDFFLAGQRLGVEIGIPVYQDLDGPQLERDWTFRAGWQWVY